MSRSAGRGEAVQGQRVLADDEVGGELDRFAASAPGGRGGRGVHEHPDAADLDDERDRGRRGRRSRGARRSPAGPLGERDASRRDLRAPPRVADRQGEGIGGVGGPGCAASPRMRVTIEVTCLLSARPEPVTAALTSVGVWKTTGMPRLVAASMATAGGVGGGHHRGDVDVGEDPLDGDDVRCVPLEPAVDLGLEVDQPLPRVGVAGVRTTPTATMAARPGPAVDDAEAAAGQAGVDAEHAHGGPPATAGAARHPVRTPVRRHATGGVRGTRPDRHARRRRAARGHSVVELGEHVVGDVAVGEDVLDVVGVLEGLDDADHLLGAVERRGGPACLGPTTPRPSRSRPRRPGGPCARPRSRRPR